MARYFQFSTSVAGRLVYILAALFVFSYIAFDVLDLDLSDFPLKRPSRQRVIVVAEIPKVIELTHSFERRLLAMGTLFQDSSIFRESIRLHTKYNLRTFRLGLNRPRIHGITHPLSSALESSPAG